MKRIIIIGIIACMAVTATAKRISIVTGKNASAREQYAVEYLQKKLTEMGHTITNKRADYKITLTTNAGNGPAESYTIRQDKKGVSVTGADGVGTIYGAVALVQRMHSAHDADRIGTISEQPRMVMRGTCIGLQKTVYLPGHGVYEYPYTPENFPWFYDKTEWVKYLDMMVENKMNSLYLWNGHPFASLVKLKDYPFALEVDEETFKKNEEMFSFLTHEADRRG
ncbi:MAG: glycoside hydrolase family 20 zincin-like fold domain-containing protein, partial [Prevotella sp.]|nr:glycoside hydrolase family 20 zincin-like fold domain-containing protein [Prevotella sp.]